MAPQTPAFAYCYSNCDIPENEGCLANRYLDFISYERSWHTLEGSKALAQAVLFEWDMSNGPPLRAGSKQAFVYVPACLKAIEIAYCVCREVEDAVKAVFKEDIARGLSSPSLPCKIRIDERLNSGSRCGSIDYKERMIHLQNYLKMCERNEHPGQGVDTILPQEYRTGPAFSKHFDLPYLDQRCYHAGAGVPASATDFTMAKIVGDTPRPDYSTGNLVVGEHYAVFNFLALTSGSEEHRVSSEQMFKLTNTGSEAWTPAFFGSYTLRRPIVSHAEDVRNSKATHGDVFKPSTKAHDAYATAKQERKDKKHKSKGGFINLLNAKNPDEAVSIATKMAKKKATKWGIGLLD